MVERRGVVRMLGYGAAWADDCNLEQMGRDSDGSLDRTVDPVGPPGDRMNGDRRRASPGHYVSFYQILGGPESDHLSFYQIPRRSRRRLLASPNPRDKGGLRREGSSGSTRGEAQATDSGPPCRSGPYGLTALRNLGG